MPGLSRKADLVGVGTDVCLVPEADIEPHYDEAVLRTARTGSGPSIIGPRSTV